MKKRLIIVLCAWSAGATAAAAAEPALVCQSGKLKATSSYAACRLKAQASAALKSGSPDYTKCDAKFGDKFPATEVKAGDHVCLSEHDASGVKSFIDACEDAVAAELAGGSLPLDVATCNSDLATCDSGLSTCEDDLATCEASFGCGDGIADDGESCDGSDLRGKTCASFGATDSPGLGCTAECSYDQTGCSYSTIPVRFRDNGDGTATDLWTGRIWEQKTGTPGSFVICTVPADCPDPHDVNNDYKWTATTTAFDGPAKTAFLDVLNDVAGGGASCFAGHCDWRLPTALELKGILLEPEAAGTCSASPCIDASFPGPTGVGGYWTGNTYTDLTTSAYYVRFDVGAGVFPASKIANRFVRAIRGGI